MAGHEIVQQVIHGVLTAPNSVSVRLDAGQMELLKRYLESLKPEPHQPWEWGWDAWVAIGTLVLAFVTTVAILIGQCNEKQKYDRERDGALRSIISLLTYSFHLPIAIIGCLAGEKSGGTYWEARKAHTLFGDYSDLGDEIIHLLSDNVVRTILDQEKHRILYTYAKTIISSCNIQMVGLQKPQLAMDENTGRIVTDNTNLENILKNFKESIREQFHEKMFQKVLHLFVSYDAEKDENGNAIILERMEELAKAVEFRAPLIESES